MAPYGKQDLNQDPWFPRNNVADWPLEDRLRFEDLQRREEGILLLKIFVVERISKNTNCICKIWKIIAVGKNMEFHRFRIFEYLNYRIFEFSGYRNRSSKSYYMQNQLIIPLSSNSTLTKGKSNTIFVYFAGKLFLLTMISKIMLLLLQRHYVDKEKPVTDWRG